MNSNGSDIEWRIEQIACAILYRCFGHVTIEKMPDYSILDLIVRYNDGTDLKFGVIIKNDSKYSSEDKARLIDMLMNVDYSQDMYRLPIVLLCVNEQTETSKIGFLVGWRFGKPNIYRNFELRNLNQKNADATLQIIKSMDSIIRILSTDNLFVRKRIEFSKKLDDNRVQKAEILYLRKLSSTYRMQQKEVVEEKERIERLLKGTPEEEYPQDKLDELIFDAVKKQFRNAKIHSKLLLFSTELDDLQYYKGIHCHHTNLIVEPNLTELPDSVLSMLNGLELFSVRMEVYVENVFFETAFDDVSFDIEEPLEGWLAKVTEWNKLKETMKPISEFFR